MLIPIHMQTQYRARLQNKHQSSVHAFNTLGCVVKTELGCMHLHTLMVETFDCSCHSHHATVARLIAYLTSLTFETSQSGSQSHNVKSSSAGTGVKQQSTWQDVSSEFGDRSCLVSECDRTCAPYACIFSVRQF